MGIETSFNDTGAAVVRGTGEVLSNKISSFTDHYLEQHAPLRAAEHHISQLPDLVESALEEAKKSINDMKAIAVTMGPGQHLSLQAGLNFAQAVGIKYNIPVIPVNHIEAHVFTPRMI